MSRIAFVLATDRNKVIGNKGGLPWKLPDDMKRVRRLTIGKPLIMGRRASCSGRGAPRGITNIVPPMGTERRASIGSGAAPTANFAFVSR